MPLPRIPPKRKTFEERLRDTDWAKFEDEWNDFEAATIAFRDVAYRTHGREAFHLRTYQSFIKKCYLKGVGRVKNDVLDAACFPDGFDALYDRMRKFVYFVIKQTKPHSPRLHSNTSYNTFTWYRNSMMYWVKKRYNERKTAPPPTARLYDELTEMARYIIRQAGIDFRHISNAAPKSHTSLAELPQLINIDLRGTPYIELVECHQLAWCISRVYAVRPGVFSKPHRKSTDPMNEYDHLIWNDFRIYHSEQPGDFVLHLKIQKVKGNQYMNTSKPTKEGAYQANNISLSVVHRLLVIAIRRNVLVGISSVEELFAQPGQEIIVKKEHLDKPVLLSGGSGLPNLRDMPMTAGALSAYLSQRGQSIGCAEPVTFYLLRRCAVTDIGRTSGEQDTSIVNCPDISYYRLFETSMVMMLESGFSQRDYVRLCPEVQCPICLADETMSEAARTKKWEAGCALGKHLKSSVHSGALIFQRQAEKDKDEHIHGKYVCPYCEQIAEDGSVPEYDTMRDLMQRIESSNATTLTKRSGSAGVEWITEKANSQAHDNLKAEAGWYEREWKGNISVSDNDSQVRMQQAVARFCVGDANDEESTGLVLYDTSPGLVSGTFVYDIPENMRDMVLTREYRTPSLKEALRSRGLSLPGAPDAGQGVPNPFEDHQLQGTVRTSERGMQISYSFIFGR